jgi:hypothetical protein
MTMNRRQRRFAPIDECPCCKARRVIVHFMNHGDEIASFHPMAFPIDEDDADKTCLVHDFGLLAVGLYVKTVEIAVWSLSEVVMTVTPKDFHIEKPGPWIGALTAIRQMFDARFGPVVAASRLH